MSPGWSIGWRRRATRCAGPHPRDGRGQVLQITEQGTALIRRMWKVYRRTIARNFAGKLPEGGAGQLAGLLQQLL